ncbi:MAG: YdcF family protein, partial [Christensenellales bacterium]
LEDQSQDTMENCRNAANLIGRKNRVLVVTSDYHLSRAVMTARRVGFDADGLAAKLPDGDAKRRLMEACYIFDLLMGWQDEGKGRPTWTYRLFARVFGEN